MQAHILKTSFNGGLLSPLCDARTDVEKYASGCRQLQNTFPRTFGAACKRPGFEYLGHTKLQQPTRLMPFNYDADTTFNFALSAGALRFWSNGAPVTGTIGFATEWDGTTSDYAPPVWVHNAGGIYFDITTHTPTVGNQPPSAEWTTVGVLYWTDATAYSVGDFVYTYTTQAIYVCTTAHTSSGSFDATKFHRISSTSYGVIDTWSTGTAYSVGSYVFNAVSTNNRYFRCKVAHTSGATTQPGVGASWTTYWTEYSTIPNHSTAGVSYLVGDPVKVGTDLYFATSSHTSSASNEPTDASSPWSKMDGVKAWDGTSTARAVGDVVFCVGTLIGCYVAHTSGTYLTNATLGNWSFFYQQPPSAWTSSPTYALGQTVYHGANNTIYICIVEHTTTTDTEPGTKGGLPYWQKLRSLFFWMSGQSYVTGQYVYSAGGTYRVLVDHTASGLSPAADVTAGNLVAEVYPLELETPYLVDELFDVATVQVNDVVWFMHPNHEIMLLQRFSDESWKFAPIEWDMPPLRDENVDDSHTLAASATTGEDVILNSSKSLFDVDHVGAYFAISHRRDDASITLPLSAVATSSALRVKGRWDLFIYGTAWKGEVVLEYSNDGSTNWLPLRSWNQPVANMRTINTNGTLEEETYLRLTMTVHSAGTTTDYATLEAADSRVTGLVKITAVNSPTQAVCDVVSSLESTDATTLWAESAYSTFRGWPRSGTLHELRLVLVGAKAEPQKVRMSRLDSFFDFTYGSLDSDAITVQAASEDSNQIRWVRSFGEALVCGTVGEEWVGTSGSEGKVLTPTNPPRMRRQSRRGSSSLQAVLLGEALLFFQNDRLKVRELSYSFQTNKYVSPDLTELAEHITKTGIKQIATVRQPDTMLYAVLNDGRLITVTYEREQNVVAWAEHVTDGTFESVSSVFGGETNADEVWVVVKRSVNGSDVRYVERLHGETSKYRFEGVADELCYLDASILVSQASSTTVNGLSALEGKTVYALADGIVRGPFTVSLGAITLPVAATTVRVGLLYSMLVQGMKLELALPDGTAQGRKQKVSRATVRTWQSSGLEYISDDTDSSLPWRGLELGDVSDVDARTVVPKDFDVSVEGRYSYQTNLTLRSQSPLPVNILSIVYVTEFTGS